MANEYKNFDIIRNNVKIYKYQNQRSAVDVTHILGSYREKRKGSNAEYLYSGRICFSVSAGGEYEKAYLTKNKAKLLFETIRNGTFTKLYPKGFQDFGGGQKEGKTFSKKLNIEVIDYNGKKKAVIRIEEMPGTRTNTGAYKPSGAPYKKVNSMLDPIDLLEMAIEVSDFINSAEIVAMSQRKPLNTMTNIDFEKVGGNSGAKKGINIQEMGTKEFHEYYLKIEKTYNIVSQEKQRRSGNNMVANQ